MQKVIIISSSPRREGNSDELCNRFLLGAQEAGHSVEKIFLKDKKINYCLGCGICFNGKKPCPQKDDMPDLLNKMQNANIIVLATPVYFYSMNAQMKTLIDRCCAQYTKMNNKAFYFIITAADENILQMQTTIDGFRAFISCLNNSIEKGIILGTGAWNLGDVKSTKAWQEAFVMGKSI